MLEVLLSIIQYLELKQLSQLSMFELVDEREDSLALIQGKKLFDLSHKLCGSKPYQAILKGCRLWVVGYRLWIVGCGFDDLIRRYQVVDIEAVRTSALEQETSSFNWKLVGQSLWRLFVVLGEIRLFVEFYNPSFFVA